MNIDERYLELLKEAVALKFRTVPKTPTDFGQLSIHIFQTTGRTIGVSTLQRVWGYVQSTSRPTFSTLSLLCRYVGYPDWDMFCTHADVDAPPFETSGFNSENVIYTDTLPVGTTIRLEWHPQKMCTIRKVRQPNDFIITDCRNIKLTEGDLVEVRSLARGVPFHAENCRHNGVCIGNYTGAHFAGIFQIFIAP